MSFHIDNSTELNSHISNSNNGDRNSYTNDTEVNIVDSNAGTSNTTATSTNDNTHDVDDEDIYQGFDQEWVQIEDSLVDVGKDLHGINKNHQYSTRERGLLQAYDSQDYLAPHSDVYLDWLKQQPSQREWDRWLVMGIIGFLVGLTGFLLHQLIDLIADTKWRIAKTLLAYGKEDYGLAWLWITAYSLPFLLVSTCLVVYYRPSAAGSGMPELIGFLNGTMMRHIFNLKTFLVKFISCGLAVGSGMPIGPEGPMIHMGSMIGAGVSQFQSKTLGLNFSFFTRFRNSEDRRNFISAGAAAGIASAFGAPVGGLLFAMEEVSSFWNMKLSWQVFFCSMTSAFTTDLFNSAFSGFKYTGGFGQFSTKKYIMFVIEDGIDVNILAIIPSIILGVMGGFLGSLFIFTNLKLAKLRRRMQVMVTENKVLKVLRVLEPTVILLLVCLLTVFIPAAFSCTNMECRLDGSTLDNSGDRICNPHQTEYDTGVVIPKPNVEHYTCQWDSKKFDNGSEYITGSYNEAATLFFGTGEKAIQQLFSRNTHLEFGYASLFTFLIIYFFLACWASGTHISCGLVVPMLLIGGLYGRILGRIFVDIFGINDDLLDWMDPGAFALLGAVSFFAGVSRLTMSLAVIMVEITNDIQFLLLIMTTIMFSKWVGDLMTHSIYHSLLELKCIPFLDLEPIYREKTGERTSLELYEVKDIMSKPPVIIREVESLSNLIHALKTTDHGGFPVVSSTDKMTGLITRFQLMTLLCKGVIRDALATSEQVIDLQVDFSEFNRMRGHRLVDPKFTQELLDRTQLASTRGSASLDLRRYVNKSAMSVPQWFSLHRAFIIFRTLGLRHLTVVNEDNNVVGIITRKDLMGFNIDEKLKSD